MSSPTTSANTAHKGAAAENKVSAEHHLKTAAPHKRSKSADAKSGSKVALRHGDAAGKHSAMANAGSVR